MIKTLLRLCFLLVFASISFTGFSQTGKADLQDNGAILLNFTDQNQMITEFKADLSPYAYNMNKEGDNFIQMFAKNHIDIQLSADKKSLDITLKTGDPEVSSWDMKDWANYLRTIN